MKVSDCRKDFKILGRKIHGKPLVYLDNAATTQKPRQVIEAVKKYYEDSNANVHRGVHALSEEATQKFEEARTKVAKFVNAEPEEIIFTKNATEALNLVANSLGRAGKARRVLSTELEHHSNIVPWQLLQEFEGAKLDFVPVSEEGFLEFEGVQEKLEKLGGAGVFSFSMASNVLGAINPVKEFCKEARELGVVSVVDAVQGVPQMPVDVKKLGCDFLAFTGHKMLAPMGVGVLWGRKELLEELPPFLGGGDMIRRVSLKESEWNELPWKFEAGTPNVGGAVGLGAAVDYLKKIGLNKVREHERKLTGIVLEEFEGMKGIRVLGPLDSQKRGGLVSFVLKGVHAHDVATFLDSKGIAVRSGHHCAMPLHEKFGIPASTRASFYVYNTEEEAQRFCWEVKKLAKGV
jgi:cysteine desulfurase/selenocysteine lyase